MCEIIGVVTEYNPFHNGHKYQLSRIKELCGNDSAVVCAMSGNFVQRGEPAIASKFARAEAACRCGADLVAELPLPWSLASAESFALGGVSVLSRFGITSLCFGAETDDINILHSIAAAADEPDFIESIKYELKTYPEYSFAEARSEVIKKLFGENAAVESSKPNNILAIEYIRAVRKINRDIRLIPVLRTGCGHDETGDGYITSASDIRTKILRNIEYGDSVPDEVFSILNKEFSEGRGPVDINRLDNAILSRLRMLSLEQISVCTENRGGLAERIYAAIRSESSVEAVCASAKTARYAMSAVKRAVLRSSLLNMDETACYLPPYARILAFNKRGRELLRTLTDESNIIIKPASVRKLSEEAQRVFAVNASAEDLYRLAFTDSEDRKCGNDWRIGPAIVK